MQASTKDKIQFYSHMKDIPKESLRTHHTKQIDGELGFILYQTLSDSQTLLQSTSMGFWHDCPWFSYAKKQTLDKFNETLLGKCCCFFFFIVL